MRFHEGFANGQTQAGPADLAGQTIVSPDKTIKYFLINDTSIFCIDPQTGAIFLIWVENQP